MVCSESIVISKKGITDNHSLMESSRSGCRPDRHGFGLIKYEEIESCAIDSDVLGTTDFYFWCANVLGLTRLRECLVYTLMFFLNPFLCV